MGFSKVLKAASVAASFAAISATSSFAVTNQFRGTNWADKRDNFVSDVLVLSGMSLNMTYESAYALSDRVMSQFVEVLGINSLRIPINEPTASKAWGYYKGIIDGILAHGRMVIGYWGPSQPSGPKNMDDWWKMWDTVVKEYGSNPDAYFEIFNEPHMYTKDQLRNLYASWLERYPDVPRDHILLDGTGMAQNVPDIADDPRFDGCLFAVHEYTFWNMSITTEQGWRNSFKGKVGKYYDRTVCTEWGGAMGPGDKAGVHYEKMDYNSTPTNYFMAYIRGMSEQLREWQMGSFYWVGLRDGDWYSMVTRSGEGANTKLSIVNQSGVDRMHYAWTDTVEVEPVPQQPFGGKAWAIPGGKIEAENFDVPGVGKGNDSFYDKDSKNNGDSDYRKDDASAVDLYKKDDGRIIVGYNQKGEWLEYTVNVVESDEYTMYAAVASANETSGFKLSMDGVDISDTLFVPKGEGENNFDDFTEVKTTVKLTKGEHILRLTITGDWMDIDYIRFWQAGCESEKCGCEEAGDCEIIVDPSAIGTSLKLSSAELNKDVVVFSATGKLLGRIDVVGNNLTASLKNAGFANGVYMVRGFNGGNTHKVHVK